MVNFIHMYAYKAAGYEFVNIDDCWAEKNRTADGELIGGLVNSCPSGRSLTVATIYLDQVRFKNGMKSLNQQIHALGL